MMKLVRIIVCLLLFLINAAKCANILGITGVLSHSHHLWIEVLGVELSKRGHNVTLLSHDASKHKSDTYTVLQMEGVYEKVFDHMNLELYLNNTEQMSINDLWSYYELCCKLDLKTEGFKALVNYPENYKFDLILWDINALECLYPLIRRFGNPPVVGLSPFGLHTFISEMMGDHYHNYNPYFGSSSMHHVNFWGRLKNTIEINYLAWSRKYLHLSKMRILAEKYFGDDIDHFFDIERKFTVALINYNPVFSVAQALAPNIIPVGGLHIQKTKPLPEDLDKVFKSAKNGVIYFSLGSNIKSEDVNLGVVESFNKCFETLPYTILWKFDNKAKKLNFPKNVVIGSWLPQNDVLAHPATKLFITHGGLLSQQQTIYHGVPVLGLPFFIDQINNINLMTTKKFGERLEAQLISPEYVCNKIKSVINNKDYRENIKAASRKVQDAPITPLETAVFWVEYVWRHGSAEELSLVARDMYTYQTLNLDIIAFVIILLDVASRLIAWLYSFIFKREKKSKLKKQ